MQLNRTRLVGGLTQREHGAHGTTQCQGMTSCQDGRREVDHERRGDMLSRTALSRGARRLKRDGTEAYWVEPSHSPVKLT
jgi:hypothetical protein